jgi:Zn ribbon nucleic-acid-binding protein
MEVVDVTFNNNRMIMGAECPECKRNLQIDAAIHFDDIKYVIPAI